MRPTKIAIRRYQYLLLLAMIVTCLSAMILRPTHKLADDGEKVNLDLMIPDQFGEWRREVEFSGQIVNPEIKEKLDQIYSQTLSRTYINGKGERMMLAVAYGADQVDSKPLHYPEACYPSQGFEIKSTKTDTIPTQFGAIRVKNLHAVMGIRSEPITYWSTVGNKVVLGTKETKLEQLKYGFNGKIPDGLLFRVSSINEDKVAGYAHQKAFIIDIVSAMTNVNRLKLAGLGDASK